MFKHSLISVLSLIVILNTLPALAQPAPLRDVEGRYFRYSLPQGWWASESPNGVTLYGPDGSTSAGTASLRGTPGQTTPDRFIFQTLQTLGVQNVRVLSSKAAPAMPGCTGVDMVYSFTDRAGRNCTGWMRCWIANNGISFDAVLQGTATVAERWEADAGFLGTLVGKISLIPGSGAMGGRR